MRKYIFAVLVILALVVMMLSVTGCAKKTDEDANMTPALPDTELGMPGDASTPDDDAADGDATPAAGGAKTLADVINRAKTPKSYEMTITAADGKEMVQLIMFKDGKPQKVSMKDDNGQAIIDVEKKKMIIYGAEEKQAVSMPMENMDDSAMFMDPSVLAQDAAITGSEKINGVDCWTSDTSLPGGDETVKVWIGKKNGLMQKVITTNKEGKTEEITFKYDRINKVKANEFELPAGIKVMSMEDMMKSATQEQ